MKINVSISLHPESKIYWFRKRVPTELTEAYKEYSGKKTIVIKVSLGVKDKEQAKQLGIEQEKRFNDLMTFLCTRAHLSEESIGLAKYTLAVGGLIKKTQTQIGL